MTYYSKSDPFVMIIMEDSAKLGSELSAVDVPLELAHCRYEFELKGNTATLNIPFTCGCIQS